MSTLPGTLDVIESPTSGMQISVDDIIFEATRDPVSYYHGEACRAILTAWNGTAMDYAKIERAHAFLGKLVQLLHSLEVPSDAPD